MSKLITIISYLTRLRKNLKKISTEEKLKKEIALKSLKFNADLIGGMTKKEAEEFLKSIGYSQTQLDKLNESTHDDTNYIIDYMETPVDDSRANYGKTKILRKHSSIISYLKDPEQWTDDETFVSKDRNIYFIDDLIGKKVTVGNETFIVTENDSNDNDTSKMELFVEEANKAIKGLKQDFYATVDAKMKEANKLFMDMVLKRFRMKMLS